jgi:hypothetical protein
MTLFRYRKIQGSSLFLAQLTQFAQLESKQRNHLTSPHISLLVRSSYFSRFLLLASRTGSLAGKMLVNEHKDSGSHERAL